MHKYISTLLLAALLYSCKTNNSKQSPGEKSAVDSSTATRYDPRVQLNLQTRSYTEIDSSGIFMLPLTAGEQDINRKGNYYKEMPQNKYWNIVFYNSQTGGTHLLGKGKMLIDEYNCQPTNYTDGPRLSSPRHIFYYITTLDNNRDKLLNSSDPQYLFVTDKTGHQLRQLSPDGYDIRQWQYIKAANKVLMLAVPDNDGNGEFGNEDEIVAFETVLDSATLPREIVSPEMKQQLKDLYDRDWKLLKRQ